jgi:6,7-dimethyl-8-ribityllumazine synthase
MTTYEGTFTAPAGRFAIVCSRFNDHVVRRLLEGATDALIRHGVAKDDIDIVWVPGAWELPLVTQRIARLDRHVAVICLGAVIRGATAHFDHVAGQCAGGLQRVGLDTNVPVTFGVLTTDNIEQAVERAGTKAGNKGADAAMAALETADLLRRVQLG